jgi:hypothetical protein
MGDLGETEWGAVGKIGLAQDRDKWRTLVNALMNLLEWSGVASQLVASPVLLSSIELVSYSCNHDNGVGLSYAPVLKRAIRTGEQQRRVWFSHRDAHLSAVFWRCPAPGMTTVQHYIHEGGETERSPGQTVEVRLQSGVVRTLHRIQGKL